MSDELGKMSYEELAAKCKSAYLNEGGAPRRTPSVQEKSERVAMSDELEERSKCQEDGAPGHAPMLSRAQVRVVAPAARHPLDGNPITGWSSDFRFADGWNACREQFARALLNLPSDAASPLEES